MSSPSINNRKARFEYEILENFVAGIVLLGPEIKSIRNGKASIAEAYCHMMEGELWIRNMNISHYEEAGENQDEAKRERKLLLKGQELRKLEKKLKDAGLTIIPLKVFMSSKGWAKVEIALARGKKLYDKRDSIKEKDVKRQLSRLKKSRS